MIIWKYTLEPPDSGDIAVLNIPEGAKILSLQVQDGHPRLWVLVDDKQPKQKRLFRILPTWYHFQLKPEMNFIGTFQLDDEGLVFHVFEILD